MQLTRLPTYISSHRDTSICTFSLVVMNINTMTFVAPNLACGEARRSHKPNWAQPSGRQFFFGQTPLLARYRSAVGYAPRERLVWPKNPLPRTLSYLGS